MTCPASVIDMPSPRAAKAALLVFIALSHPAVGRAQTADSDSPPQPTPTSAPQGVLICASQPGERTHCPADTSAGVVLVRSTGAAPCLLGKTWGYDDTGIWVSDGCGGEFVAGPGRAGGRRRSRSRPSTSRTPGFCLRRRQGPDLLPALQLRALSEPAEPRRVLRRRLRQHAHRAAAPGHPAAEVLRAVLRLVPDAEVPLLPLRLVVEHLAGRSGAGRRRRQPELHLQPIRDASAPASRRCRPCEAPKASSRTGSASTTA